MQESTLTVVSSEAGLYTFPLAVFLVILFGLVLAALIVAALSMGARLADQGRLRWHFWVASLASFVVAVAVCWLGLRALVRL